MRSRCRAELAVLHEAKREIKSDRVNDRHVYPVTGYKRESRIRSTGRVLHFYLRFACSHRETVDLIPKVPGVATPVKRDAPPRAATRVRNVCVACETS